MDTNFSFKSIMFVYSMETRSDENPTGNLKVYIPDIFPDINFKSIKTISNRKGSQNIYLNGRTPALSEHYTESNYITLKIEQGTNLGYVSKDDKLIAIFPNNNPRLGYIIGRC